MTSESVASSSAASVAGAVADAEQSQPGASGSLLASLGIELGYWDVLAAAVLLLVVGGIVAKLRYSEYSHAKALEQAAAEATALAKSPRTFTPVEYADASAHAPPLRALLSRRAERARSPPSAAPPAHAAVTRARRLRQYNGLTASKPLLLSIKGRVLDVREGHEYYGPQGPYHIMAGCDASKAFAMMSLKPEDAHNDLTGVDETHLKILDDWYDKLTKKYPTCGRLASKG